MFEILFFICLTSGFLSSRSTALKDRAMGGNYYEDSAILSIIMLLNMISTFAVLIWGFIYLKWYLVVGSFLFIAFFLSQKFFLGRGMPYNKVLTIFLYLVTTFINAFLWFVKLL